MAELMSGARSSALRDLPTRRALVSKPGAGDRLAAFLREQAARGFDWAGAHCLALPADWAVLNGRPDPAEGWRQVASEAEAEAVLARFGGVLELARASMARFEPCPTHAVRRGDIGLVEVEGPDGPGLAGAICTSIRWAGRGPRGIWIARARPVAAWRLEA